MPDPNKLIVILGAHRSGTSLCAAAIEALGASLGIDSAYANEENRKGFFEHPELVDFNDRLLLALGGTWDNPLFVGAEALAGIELADWRADAQLLLQKIAETAVAGAVPAKAASAPVIAIKDPRICQLLDFWLPVFEQAGYGEGQLYFVHTLRDPCEVALSQQRRSQANPDFYELGRELPEGAALWLSLSAQALASGGHLPTYYLAYEELLSRPQQLLTELAQFLGLAPEPQQVANFCADFVDPALRRSTAVQQVEAELFARFPQALEFNHGLRQLLANSGNDEADREAALAVSSRADTREQLARIVTPALSRLSDSCRSDRLAVQLAREEVANLQQQRAELEQSRHNMREEHSAVVAPLEQELDNLRAAIAQLQQQVGDQASETVAQAKEFRAEIARLEDDVAHLVREREALEKAIWEMEVSLSWRITRPLRSLRARQQALRDWLARRWGQLRLRATLSYHRLSVSHPATAFWLRRLLRPPFKLLNGLLGRNGRGAGRIETGGLLNPMSYQQVEPSEDFAPLVSVIVPNYNHADYLALRLDSIFSQTYSNFEVILLDDASSDDSASILRDYHQRYPQQSTLVINEENSGGVFHQWDRGLALARGDIIWIAESDDWCTENFLQTLVPYFDNEAIQIAYASTVFMDGAGDREIWSINEYLHDLDAKRWHQPFVATGQKIVAEAFAVRNIIPNVSSALMRSPRNLELLQDPDWRSMRTCGDWLLYLHLLRGGMLAYSPEARNYYRMHGSNTSVGSYAEDAFYREHEQVALAAQQYFDVPADAGERLRDGLVRQWQEYRDDYSEEVFEQAFCLTRIEEQAAQRAPNLLMASYAFCAGGGETFPVDLANIMKAWGYNVTYLDCAREPRNEGVRNRLRADIPVVSDFSQLERIVMDFGIDVIHSHHAWMDSTVLDLLPEDAPVSTVVTLHGMYETIDPYRLREILPRLVRRSERLIYVAEKNLDALRQHKLLDKAQVVRIDNALQDAPFEPVQREQLGIPTEAFVLTLVSRAMEEKGWVEGIEAVALAREQSGRDIHLVLAGDGPEYERLSTETLPPYIHLEGFQRNVRGYFALADVGFLPSRFSGESFPLVIIECLQAGRPFIATDLGEISYMLAGPEGPAGASVALTGEGAVDIPPLAAEIARQASDADYFASLAARVPEVVSKFDPAILAARHDEVYRAAVQAD